MMNRIGLYIHIPFCRKICNYCDFYKRVSSKQNQIKYVDYLIKDLMLNIKPYKTIYIGGGTPSSLELPVLSKLLKKINDLFNIDELEEFTIEVNPEDINVELIECLKKYKVNRISIGIQTFHKRLCKYLGRYSDYDDIKTKITLLKENGFDNINIDLMYGIANESIKELEEDIDMMLSLDVTHISTYSLILEEKTILYHLYQKGLFSLSNEDEERSMYDLIIKKLTDTGYLHYEISNFSKKMYESKHNVIYWSNEEYVGIGAGSSGYENGFRYKNTTDLKNYYSGIDNNNKVFEEYEFIDVNTKMWEEVMLGLRLIDGLSIESFYQKYKVSIFDAFPKIEKLIEQGFLEIVKERIKITHNNFYISNAILTEIM